MAGENAEDRIGSGLIARLAAELLDNAAIGQLQAESTEQIFEAEPGYADAGIVIAEVHRATRDTLLLSLSRLAGAAVSDDLAAAPLEIGRLRAEQGVPLSAMLHASRLDFRVLWAAMVRQARSSGVSAEPEFVDGCIDVWNAVDLVTEEMVSAYRGRELELHDRRSDERETAFNDLLARADQDVVVRGRAARLLGFRETGRFTVVCGALPDDQGTSLGRLRTALVRKGIASHFSGAREDIRGIIDSSALAASEARALLDLVAGGRIGVADVTGGLGEIPRGVRLATAVIDAMPADATGVSYLTDEWMTTMLHRDPELADSFVSHVLGPILDLPDDQCHRLLTTFESFVSCGGSISAVAASTYLHRNSVRKRLDRIEELTGRSLSSPEQTAELVLAAAWLNRRMGSVGRTAERHHSDLPI
jgi:hypothetical protein